MADINEETAPDTQVEDNADSNVDPNAADGAEVIEGEQQTPAQTTPQPPAFDPQTNFDGLRKEYETLGKSYSELRREFTRRSQNEADLKRQMELLTKTVSQATQKEISPEEFIKSLQSQGVKAFDPLKQQWMKEIQEQYDNKLNEMSGNYSKQSYELEVLKRQLDSESYPDFAKLRPAMAEIADSENCPVDLSQPVSIVMDALYKLAKSLNADNSVKEAREMGRKEADLQAAKEASTAVAGGGKAGSMVNPNEIKDIGKLREYFVSQLGESD